MAGGRPLKFQSVKELQDAIDAYFASCYDEAGELTEPLTITGLALALDTTRQTLINYEERPEFLDAIKRAKTRVENFAEKRLYASNPSGAIFALKNFDWSDKREVDNNHSTLDAQGKKTGINPSKLSESALLEILNATTPDK
jgi:hypothetical protein